HRCDELRIPTQRHSMSLLALDPPYVSVRGLAQAQRLIEDGVEYRCEVAGGGVDDLQHLGGRGLLLQSLARLGQEPRVFHRDDRLRREVLQERDLLVGERSDFLTE